MSHSAFMKFVSLILTLVFSVSPSLAESLIESGDPPNLPRESKQSEVAFLGLLATELSPVVSRQLGLADNLYLAVGMVSPGGPAHKAGLNHYDILKMLDDQVLINPGQLVELVRSRKVGQEVSLSILRAGKEKTLKVKLGRKKISDFEGAFNLSRQVDRDILFPDAQAWGDHIRRQIERRDRFFSRQGIVRDPVDPQVLEDFDADGDGKLSQLERIKAMDEGGMARQEDGLAFDFGPGSYLEKIIKDAEKRGGVSTWSSVTGSATTKIIHSDGGGTYEFSSKDGDKHFKVTSENGEVLFDGPVNTPNQRKDIPSEMKSKLDKLEGSVRLKINQSKPDAEGKGNRLRKRFF